MKRRKLLFDWSIIFSSLGTSDVFPEAPSVEASGAGAPARQSSVLVLSLVLDVTE